jgi:tRNA-dihydrouridine synthase B
MKLRSKFSENLNHKIDTLLKERESIELGSLRFDSKLLLAPMAGICTPNIRLFYETLGAGGTVSELISCHGVNYQNKKTLEMLKIDEREDKVGIQLFGEDPLEMAKAAKVALRSHPKFIDINMGCPVRKVVTKGGGSALMKDINTLGHFFNTVRSAIDVPLTIKIRMGWDADDVNADKICEIAYNEGVEMVAIHGRTRAQQYTGSANWDYIEWLAEESKLPLIGNGDLHQPHQVKERLKQTKCGALMIARGCLRNPFIFLEGLSGDVLDSRKSLFNGSDYFEAINLLYDITNETFTNERMRMVQMRKLIVWFAAGFPNAAAYRGMMFKAKELDDVMKLSEDYFLSLGHSSKKINFDEAFMNGGHG